MNKADSEKLDELIATALYMAIDDEGQKQGGGGGGSCGEGEGEEEGEKESEGGGSPPPGSTLTLESGEGEEADGEGEEPQKGAGGVHVLADVVQYQPLFALDDAHIGEVKKSETKSGRRYDFAIAAMFAKCADAPRLQAKGGAWYEYPITPQIRKYASVFARATRFPIRAEAGKQSASSGKFNPRKAHRLEMPDSLMMFRQHKAISAPSAEIVILVDSSGSTRMETYHGKNLLDHFMTTAAILYEALKMVGVPCHILGYARHWSDWVVGDTFTYNNISGGTNTATAMEAAYMRLKDSQAKTRIIANLTDGSPDSVSDVGTATNFLLEQGIHTLGCLIMPNADKKCMDGMKKHLALHQYTSPETVVVGNNTEVFLQQIAEAMRYASMVK